MIRPALLALVALLAFTPAQALRASNLGSEYDILNRKNIFSKNRLAPQREGRPDNGRRSRRTYTPVLIGVMREDDGFIAFIVDPESRDISGVRQGDVLPSNAGTLKEVTLDYIITDPGNGKPPTRVLIGQNILGGAPEYPDASADSSDNDGPTASTPAPAGPGRPGPQTAGPAGPAPSGASTDDIVERLRKRRQQQLGK